MIRLKVNEVKIDLKEEKENQPGRVMLKEDSLMRRLLLKNGRRWRRRRRMMMRVEKLLKLTDELLQHGQPFHALMPPSPRFPLLIITHTLTFFFLFLILLPFFTRSCKTTFPSNGVTIYLSIYILIPPCSILLFCFWFVNCNHHHHFQQWEGKEDISHSFFFFFLYIYILQYLS